MGIAPRNQTRRQGEVNLLVPPPRPPIQGLGESLSGLQREWKDEGSLAGLWQAWPRIAGPQLAPHCRPLRLHGGRLVVGANHPQWLQALRFNKHQLLGALRGAGFAVKDLQFQQHQSTPLPRPAMAWKRRCGLSTPAAWTSLGWAPAQSASAPHRSENSSVGGIAASANGTR